MIENGDPIGSPFPFKKMMIRGRLFYGTVTKNFYRSSSEPSEGFSYVNARALSEMP